VLKSQIGGETSFHAQPHKVKKSQPDFSNTPFEKTSGWLVLSPVDPEFQKNGKPYGHDECSIAESMLPLSLLDLRSIKRGASSFIQNMETLNLIASHSFHPQSR
jgi:hypothetical protein